MPRPYLGPKLWLDPRRGTWTILDGRRRIRTGILEHERDRALQALERRRRGLPVAPEQPRGPVPEWLKNGLKGVYVIGYGPYVKIGVSTNIKYRMAALQTPEPAILYATLDGWVKEEKALHRRFDAYRLNGEWFRNDGDLAEWIDGGCK